MLKPLMAQYMMKNELSAEPIVRFIEHKPSIIPALNIVDVEGTLVAELK